MTANQELKNFFARAKSLHLLQDEKFSIFKTLSTFINVYQSREAEVSLEHEQIFFARLTAFLKNSRNVRLTSEEKRAMQGELVRFMEAHPVVYFEFSPLVGKFFSLLAKPAMAMAAALIVFGGGGTLYAARAALPGDFLYSVKVAVYEKLPSFFAYTETSKVKWEAVRAGNRLLEAEKLATNGMLDAEATALIESDLSQRVLRVDRWSNQVEAEQAVFAEGIEESMLRLRALADSSVLLNSAIAKNGGDFETAAGETLLATETRIAEVRLLVNEKKHDLSTDQTKEIRKRLRAADGAVTEGRVKLRGGLHREAFVLFQEAFILAKEAEALLPQSE